MIPDSTKGFQESFPCNSPGEGYGGPSFGRALEYSPLNLPYKIACNYCRFDPKRITTFESLSRRVFLILLVLSGEEPSSIATLCQTDHT